MPQRYKHFTERDKNQGCFSLFTKKILFIFQHPMQLVTPKLVATAVRMAMIVCASVLGFFLIHL